MNGTRGTRKVKLRTKSMFDEVTETTQATEQDSTIADTPQYYAFTQTLNSKVFGRVLAPDQYDKTAYHLSQVYNSATGGACTVVCELTEAGDCHYHGFLTAPGLSLYKVQYRLSQRLKACKFFGFKKIKLVDDFPGWKEYIMKDVVKTAELLGRRPIVEDKLGLIPFDMFEAYGNMPNEND